VSDKRTDRDIDPRLVAALTEQLANRSRLLDAGAKHVGWKLGMGERESIGGEIAVGHLTSATCLESGSTHRAGAAAQLHADAEVAVELGRDVDPDGDTASVDEAMAVYAPALEIVDLAPIQGEPESVVAANVFHHAVAFGPWRDVLPNGTVDATLVVDGVERARDRVEADLGDRLIAAARLLRAVGERLLAGDRIITGLIVQVLVERGNEVAADFGPFGAARLMIAP
jgi:2-keto-4-pentenoate hydratase